MDGQRQNALGQVGADGEIPVGAEMAKHGLLMQCAGIMDGRFNALRGERFLEFVARDSQHVRTHADGVKAERVTVVARSLGERQTGNSREAF